MRWQRWSKGLRGGGGSSSRLAFSTYTAEMHQCPSNGKVVLWNLYNKPGTVHGLGIQVDSPAMGLYDGFYRGKAQAEARTVSASIAPEKGFK